MPRRAVRMFGPSAAMSGHKRPEERGGGMEPSPFFFSVMEVGRERVLERWGGVGGVEWDQLVTSGRKNVPVCSVGLLP